MKKLIMTLIAGVSAIALNAAATAERQPKSARRPIVVRSTGDAKRVQKPSSVKTVNKPSPVKTVNKPSGEKSARDAKTGKSVVVKRRGVASKRGHRVDHRDRMSKHDRRLIERIEEADSMRELRRYMQDAVASREEDVRMAMIEALDGADHTSPSDFAYFIADPSEEVSEAAFSAWTSALEDARPHRRARAIIEAAEILKGASGGHMHGAVPPPAQVVVPANGVVPATTVVQPAPAVVQPIQTVVQPAETVEQPAVPVVQPVAQPAVQVIQ